jgi:hypothetical protein
MSFLFNRGLVLAKIESVFRTDAVATPGKKAVTGLDAATAIDAVNDEVISTAHGLTAGEGPIRFTPDPGDTLPAPLEEGVDYFVNPDSAGVPANEFRVFDTRENAILDSATGLQDLVAGTPAELFSYTKTTADDMLVAEPNFNADVAVLDRTNTKTHLSVDPGAAGRKTATVTFTHEVRGGGGTDSDGQIEPALSVLLQGCGYEPTNIVGDRAFGPGAVAGPGLDTVLDGKPTIVNGHGRAFDFVVTTDYTEDLPRLIELVCAVGGPPDGTATFTVESPAVGNQPAIAIGAAALQGGSPFTISQAGTPAVITPTVGTFTGGDFVSGDRLILQVVPAGYCYEPVSDDFESLTLDVYFGDTSDAVRHTLTGARGTFTVEGEAGNFAVFNFTFTGDYVDPVDEPGGIPAGSAFETTIPAQVELANLTVAGGQDDVVTVLCAQSFSIDAGNNVVARDCINENESLAGAEITGRTPTAQFNPEMELEATHPFWGNLSSADKVSWQVRIGTERGNCITFFAPFAQYTTLAYGNRNDLRTAWPRIRTRGRPATTS